MIKKPIYNIFTVIWIFLLNFKIFLFPFYFRQFFFWKNSLMQRDYKKVRQIESFFATILVFKMLGGWWEFGTISLTKQYSVVTDTWQPSNNYQGFRLWIKGVTIWEFQPLESIVKWRVMRENPELTKTRITKSLTTKHWIPVMVFQSVWGDIFKYYFLLNPINILWQNIRKINKLLIV